MPSTPTVMLTPVVRFREFPFGTRDDQSMREFLCEQPWENQDKVLQYLRSGLILGVIMGADLTDWLDPPHRANPILEGRQRGGVTEMTDGIWFWHAGLIHFVEKYNVRLPQRFVEYAASHHWLVDQSKILPCRYEVSYFETLAPAK